MTTKQRPEKIRFEEKYNRRETDKCWEWQAYVCPTTGYGRFGDSKKVEGAHRVSFRLYVGDPAGKVVRHTCDNRKCVNPNHLVLGSHSDNMQDMAERGRSPMLGEKSWNAKLTEQDILLIRERRAQGESAKVIAKEYDITPQQCSGICLGAYWSHVGGPLTGRKRIGQKTKNDVLADFKAGMSRKECQEKYQLSKSAVQKITVDQ